MFDLFGERVCYPYDSYLLGNKIDRNNCIGGKPVFRIILNGMNQTSKRNPWVFAENRYTLHKYGYSNTVYVHDDLGNLIISDKVLPGYSVSESVPDLRDGW